MASLPSVSLFPCLARLAFTGVALLTLGRVTTSAATPREIESQSAPSRDHHLFVGLDLSIPHESTFVPVRKLTAKGALLDNPTRDRVPLSDSPRFRIKMSTKVSANSAAVSKLKAQETYSPGADPEIAAMMDQARIQNAIADQVDQAEQALSTADVRAAAAAEAINADPDSARGLSYDQTPEGILEIANTDFGEALAIHENLMDTLDFGSSEDHEKDYDALRVTFEVASEFPIADAVAVVVVRLEHEHELSDFTMYQAIGLVNQKPRKVSFYHTGFPRGFKAKETRVFVYNHGEEIATNLSEKHYPLTSAEAREFVQLDHQGSHRRDTVPGAPAWSLAPPVLQASESPRDFNFPVQVELDAAGNLIAIKTDDTIVPDRVRAVIEQTTFVPALEKGKPVASTLTVNPADFFKD